MAAFKYFSDVGSSTTELTRCYGLDNAKFAAQFPLIAGKRYDSFSRRVGFSPDGVLMPVTRIVEFKANPSRHKCDDRCLNASGRIMRCECSCGGVNHGKGG